MMHSQQNIKFYLFVFVTLVKLQLTYVSLNITYFEDVCTY